MDTIETGRGKVLSAVIVICYAITKPHIQPSELYQTKLYQRYAYMHSGPEMKMRKFPTLTATISRMKISFWRRRYRDRSPSHRKS